MRIGQKVRDYVFEERIGVGGMGEVWRALHTGLQRKVAIKVMDPHIADDPEFEQRFVQEARAQAALQHPRIIQVADFFSDEGVYYLVMPLINGVSLDARLAQSQGPLALEETLKIVQDVLEGLNYAHQHRIIHRDVKPSNILLDAAGHAYLFDFGIALMVGQDRRTRTGSALGTPDYMSPEQIQDPRAIDHRADVYSIGCVIYEMLTGRPPFCFSDDQRDISFLVQQAHVTRAPDPLRKWNPTVPREIERVILRALSKDPDERWGGCGEFLQALKVCPSTPRPPDSQPADPKMTHRTSPPPLPPPRRSKSPFFWMGSIFGCLILGIILIAVMLVTSNDTPEPTQYPLPVQTESQVPSQFSKIFRGKVGKFDVKDFQLTRSGRELRGVYRYPPPRTTSLVGTVEDDGTFTINEYLEGKKHTGIYVGRFTASSAFVMEGIWSDPNRPPNRPLSMNFRLEEIGN